MKTWAEMAEIQPLATRILTNSIKKGRISHAYLVQGARGTGKEAISHLLAKGIFCQEQVLEPCGECPACRRIDSGNHPDVHWVIPGEHSIKKEQIDFLKKEASYTGLESNRKVYIIKEADKLTPQAANRILKFLEEPHLKTTAMLLTANSQSIIPTIRSRCQVLDLKPLDPTSFHRQLLDNGVSEKQALLLGALTNKLDEALEWNHDEWFTGAKERMKQLTDLWVNRPSSAFLYIHSDWMPHFKERHQQTLGIDLLLLAFRDFLYYHIRNTEKMVVFQMDDALPAHAVRHYGPSGLLDALQHLLDAREKLMQHVHPTLVMEEAALQLKR